MSEPVVSVKLTRPKPEELSGREVESYSPDGFATVHIIEHKPNQYRYVVEDPPVTKAQLRAVRKIIEDELIYVARPSDVASWEALERLLKRAGVRDEKVIYLIGREVVGYKALHPLMMDEKLEDILGIGPEVPVVVLHKDYGRIPTNLSFTEREMDELVRTLAYRGGKTISRFLAKLDSVILPTGDRCRLVYRSEISPSSNFTIRKFPRHPWTPTRILATGMISPEAMAWLWLAIEYKLPIMTYGMMGSGKTSLNNALAMLIRPDSSLALISDVPEMKVPHPIKYEFYARQPETLGGTGAITLEDLVAHALRASVEYVIINEVRFAEARAFVHAIGIGHGGCTSAHAGSLNELFGRLKDLKVERSIAGELRLLINTTVFVAVREGKPTRLRRVKAIYFLESLSEDWEPRTTTLYEYDPARDELVGRGVEDSRLLELLQLRSLRDKGELMEEHRVRAKFLADATKAFIKTGRYGEADEWFSLLKEFYAARGPALKSLEEEAAGVEIPKAVYEIVGEEEELKRMGIPVEGYG